MPRIAVCSAENRTHGLISYSISSTIGPLPLVEEDSTATRLGEQPTQRPILGSIDVCSIILSLLSLAVAYLVVSSRLPWAWAWKLGMTNQIIIIGFLLSIQALCLKRVVPLCWLMLEAKFGGSVLQNYDAIIQNTALIPHTSLVWRCVIGFSLILPICLSVAYKQFANHMGFFDMGLADLTLGLFGPPGLNNFGFNTGLYMMANATQPYTIALQAADPSSSLSVHRTAQLTARGIGYGFNNLVLPNRTSAFVDVPAPDVIDRIQRNLRPTETQYLGAVVNAIVTAHRPLSLEERNSPDFWERYYLQSPDSTTTTTSSSSSFSRPMKLSRWDNLSMLIASEPHVNTSWCFLGIYPSMANSLDGPHNSPYFRMHAEMFVTHRRRCEARWSITATSVRIEDGQCGQEYTNQEYFNSTRDRDWYTYYLQPLSELLGGYIGRGDDYSQAAIPAMANAVAAMYWSRFVVMDGVESGRDRRAINGTDPPVISEAQRRDSFYNSSVTILSSVQTLDSSYPLHLILGLQPFLLILAVCCIIGMRDVAVDYRFGLASIFSAIGRLTNVRIEGGSLSGLSSLTVQHRHHRHQQHWRPGSFTSDYKNDFVHRYSGRFYNDFCNDIPNSSPEDVHRGRIRFEVDE